MNSTKNLGNSNNLVTFGLFFLTSLLSYVFCMLASSHITVLVIACFVLGFEGSDFVVGGHGEKKMKKIVCR